ncbi:MAG TPA: isoprenylcysteine carboxylmethyltransferase family protein [Vicinamibacterales bacterium]|nr:isoprenylcysteine carboxylmethyltransferase family protein [Vicinamibacterales bacterium]HPW19487.1 isoprenylcysteine carboxylmethyltransferase family protein [Vicinamibacterales bacterium]
MINGQGAARGGLNEDGRRRIRRVAAMMGVIALAMFVPAGRFGWVQGWVYVGLYAAAVIAGGSWVVRRNPAAINARGRRDGATARFDRVLAPVMLGIGLAQYVVAGLDERFGWSSVPAPLQALGAAGLLASMAGAFWAMASNPFLATTVRIGEDGSHRVATAGPYRIVRHPMYASSVWFAWATGCLLDSWWAVLCSALSAVLFIVRTALEDRALVAGLEGYREYAARVRYRLAPGVW